MKIATSACFFAPALDSQVFSTPCEVGKLTPVKMAGKHLSLRSLFDKRDEKPEVPQRGSGRKAAFKETSGDRLELRFHRNR